MADVTTAAVVELLLDSLNLREEYDPEEVAPDASLFGDDGLGLDSLDALQLAVAIEERFGVTIGEDEGETVFQSVNTIVAHIAANSDS